MYARLWIRSLYFLLYVHQLSVQFVTHRYAPTLCTVCFISLCTSSLYQLLYAVMQQLTAHVVMYRYVPALCSVRCILYQICVLFAMSRCAPALCVLLSTGGAATQRQITKRKCHKTSVLLNVYVPKRIITKRSCHTTKAVIKHQTSQKVNITKCQMFQNITSQNENRHKTTWNV